MPRNTIDPRLAMALMEQYSPEAQLRSSLLEQQVAAAEFANQQARDNATTWMGQQQAQLQAAQLVNRLTEQTMPNLVSRAGLENVALTLRNRLGEQTMPYQVEQARLETERGKATEPFLGRLAEAGATAAELGNVRGAAMFGPELSAALSGARVGEEQAGRAKETIDINQAVAQANAIGNLLQAQMGMPAGVNAGALISQLFPKFAGAGAAGPAAAVPLSPTEQRVKDAMEARAAGQLPPPAAAPFVPGAEENYFFGIPTGKQFGLDYQAFIDLLSPPRSKARKPKDIQDFSTFLEFLMNPNLGQLQ